jgi:hypothetical protein
MPRGLTHILGALLLITVLVFAGIAAANIGKSDHVVGNVQSVGVVVDEKWQPMVLPMKLPPSKIQEANAYRCLLTRCENESTAIVALIKAGGLLKTNTLDETKMPDADGQTSELDREKALDFFNQTMGVPKMLIEDNLRSVTVGSLSGFRANIISPLSMLGVSGEAQTPAVVVELLAAGDTLIFLTGMHPGGDSDVAEAVLSDIEAGIQTSGKKVVE